MQPVLCQLLPAIVQILYEYWSYGTKFRLQDLGDANFASPDAPEDDLSSLLTSHKT